MTSQADLKKKLWKALASDRTVMLGLDGAEQGHTRPMTAQFEDEQSPLWFFSSRDTALFKALGTGHRAVAAFAAKDHSLFASISGRLSEDTDRTLVDKFWSPFVAAWYDGGKDDPKLVLLRLDAADAEVWLSDQKLLTGIKILLGADVKEDAMEKAKTVNLR